MNHNLTFFKTHATTITGSSFVVARGFSVVETTPVKKGDMQMGYHHHYHRLKIYFDGASRKNPRGPAGCGWCIYEMDDHGAECSQVARGWKYLEYNVSNFQAEYEGVEAALQFLYDHCISCYCYQF